ncbi:hypothetical protein MSAN_01076800 [Mycena sanguinolenta]|uniref:Uncharacterized protein n=1 Tax=Mycena sanguinolenta TaxID=230812 RepID=A0A8H6YUM2_9AGAR|nr:hypothetical protein MSAN_01076800 [Mycena sanguinolenta]
MKLQDMGHRIWIIYSILNVFVTASSDSSVPVIGFNNIVNMTSCKSAVITWTYSPISAAAGSDSLSLAITSAAPFRNNKHIYVITPAPIQATLLKYSWQSVNVTQGWYALVATFPSAGFEGQSLPFYVQSGSCSKSKISPRAIAGVVAGAAAIFAGPGAEKTIAAPITLDVGSGHNAILPQSTNTPESIETPEQFEDTVQTSSILMPEATNEPTSRAQNYSMEETVLAFDMPIPDGVIETQEAMLLKAARLREESPAREDQTNEGFRAQNYNMEETVLAFDRPILDGVIEIQEAMLLKVARLREESRAREDQPNEGHMEALNNSTTPEEEEDVHLLLSSQPAPPGGPVSSAAISTESLTGDRDLEQMGTPELARQLRAMAERMALMEAQIRTHGISDERPPDYTAQLQ